MANPLGRLAFTLAVFVGSVWLGMQSASAHPTLQRSEPGASARLPSEPATVALFFDEPVNVALGRLTVLGPGGAPVSAGHTTRDGGRTLTIALRPGAGLGTYVVSYRAMSPDSHPISGGFFFFVGSAAAARSDRPAVASSPAETRAAPENRTVSAVYAACRYAAFIGLVLLAGSLVFLFVLGAGGAPSRVVVLAWLGLGVVTCGSGGELVLQVPYAAGTPLSGITRAGFEQVVNTSFGTAHLLRLALLALAAPLLAAFEVSGSGIRYPRWAAASAGPLGLALALTWAYSGHAGTTTPAISVPSDVIHLAAVAVWVGGLLVLAIAVLPVAGARELRAALPRWSLVAMVSVLALIVSGIVQALLELDGWSRLVDTAYGQLLLAKTALLAVVLAVAGYSRRWVQRWYATRAPHAPPQIDPSRADVRRLRRAVVAESLLATAAVGVAAMLIEAAPGRSAEPTAPQAAPMQPVITRHGAYVATVRRGDVVIHLKVDPAVVGVQYIYLDATRPDGRRIKVRQWTLTISKAALGMDRVDIPVLVDVGVGHHYVYGSFTMTTGGIWTVEVTARTSGVDETVVSCRVAVRE
ncbi:MAG: CopD family protein [Actinomycetota bacterium]